MPYLKCTKVVRDFAGIKTDGMQATVETPNEFGNWYVNMFTVDRKKTLIFMNERTLMSFIVYGLKKSNCSDLHPIFLGGIEQLLQMEDVPEDRIGQIIKTYAAIRYAKTDNRASLGNMNDLVFAYKVFVLDGGGFSHCDLYETIHRINRTPQRNLGWRYSVEAMREILDKLPPAQCN